MAVRIEQLLRDALDDLRIHPTHKRIRAMLGDATVVDSTEAMIVSEPRRVVASYAVPPADVAAELVPYTGSSPRRPPRARGGRC